MELGNDPSELLNALDDASCLEAAVPDRRVGVANRLMRVIPSLGYRGNRGAISLVPSLAASSAWSKRRG